MIETKSIELYDDKIGKVEYIQHIGSDKTVVNSARVSFGQDNELPLTEKDKKLIKYLIAHKHTSTLEHCSVTFKVTVPLFVRSQHHRHRTWCLAGDTEITFNRPDRWKKGLHTKQSGNKNTKFTIERLYKLWTNPAYHNRIKNMLVRVYDEKTEQFTVSNVDDVIFSGTKEIFKLTLDDGKEIKCSKDHLFLTKNGWQTLENAIGLLKFQNTATMSKDEYFLTNGTVNFWRSYAKAIKIEFVGLEPTYDLTIKGENHNFVANGIVVHNSYNEISRRYTDINIQFYEPKLFRSQSESNRQASTDELINPEVKYTDLSILDDRPYKSASRAIKLHHEYSLNLYENLIDVGVCREQARGVLPQNMYTEYYATTNLNNLMKFISLRLHEGAQWEIQRVAEAMLQIAEEIWPITVSFYKEQLNEKNK